MFFKIRVLKKIRNFIKRRLQRRSETGLSICPEKLEIIQSYKAEKFTIEN